jgi:Ulp1 family protease
MHNNGNLIEVGADLTTLLGQDWITDAQINASGEYINSHAGRSPSIQVRHSYFLGSLAFHFNPSLPWVPRSPRPLDKLISDGKITELIIPVHCRNHWTLLYINIPVQAYVYTDTLNIQFTHAPHSCIRLIDWWLSSVLHRSCVLTNLPRPFSVGAQSDGSSCGVAVMTTMAHVALGSQFHAWSQELTTGDRMDWFLRLSEDISLSIVSTCSGQIVLPSNPWCTVYIR